MTSCTLLLLSSCHKEDNFTETVEVFSRPEPSGDTPVGLKIKEMYERYNVLFKPVFDTAEYTWDWSKSVAQTKPNETGLRYTPAKIDYVIPVIDSVKSWVFESFPYEFSKAHMPLNILLTDTLGNKFAGVPMIYRMYEGNVASNYILLSYVSERFNTEKNKRTLRECWLSLFVEKMMVSFPTPYAFAAVNTSGYAKVIMTNAEDVMVNYAMLKKARTKQIAGTATASWGKVTLQQDFGDFVAFIVFTPEAEKQLIYAKNSDIKKKADLVKTYFKTNFGITLPYRPI